MVPLATGDEPIGQLFRQAGCVVCHTIPGIPGAEGREGPKLVLGSTGTTRLADPGYRGEAKTVREYIVESILAPGVYVVPGYPDRAMPRWYGQKLSAGALDKIAAYLERTTENGALSGS
jgi:mono/diheme cytochrome c family protein